MTEFFEGHPEDQTKLIDENSYLLEESEGNDLGIHHIQYIVATSRIGFTLVY